MQSGTVVRRRDFSDKKMAAKEDGYFLKHYTLQPISVNDLSDLLHKRVKTKHIIQKGIGNCYLLAVLASLLEKDPAFIQQIVRVNKKGKVEVTLYNANDVNTKYIYVLDPTIVRSKEMNLHRHAAIFFIEKAYAIYRREHERKSPSVADAKVITVFKRNDFDIEKTIKALSDAGKAVTSEEINNLSIKYKIHYNDSLTKGSSGKAYATLLGINADFVRLQKVDKDPFQYFLKNFIRDILNHKHKTRTVKVLTEMFGNSKSNEAVNLRKYINIKTLDDLTVLLANLHDLLMHHSKATILKDFFSKITGLSDSTRQKMNAYFDKHIPNKRGAGIYTPKQEETYCLIKRKLSQGECMTIGTMSHVGRKDKSSSLFADTGNSKGLIGCHEYSVLGCYEKEGSKSRKFVLVRNPWGNTVRDYQKEIKCVDGSNVEVLRPVKKTQLESERGWCGRFFGQPKPDPYKENGHFELELSDIKRISHIVFVNRQQQSSATSHAMHKLLDHVINFKNIRQLERCLNKYMYLVENSQNKNDLMDSYAVLALYYHQSERPELAREALFDLNSVVKEQCDWGLEDALNYLQLRYNAYVPNLSSFAISKNEARAKI